MNKQAFIKSLRKKLSPMPRHEREEQLTFYSEMIDDRMEEGLSEEEAVAAIGNIDDIASQILTDASALPFEEERPKRQPLKGWEILLLVLGSPLWVSLLAAGGSIILALVIVAWSVVLTLWVVCLPFILFGLFGKYLLIGCKEISRWGFVATKQLILLMGRFFGKGRKVK